MAERGAEALVRRLARDLRPVRPLPPLRGVLGALLGALVAAVALQGWLGWPVPGLSRGLPWTAPAFGMVLAGLGAVGVGGVLWALAAAVPGREAAARGGRSLALLGAGLALVGALAWLGRPGALEDAWPVASIVHCLLRASALALAPGLVALAFVRRGFALSARGALCLAAVGAAGLGAVVVHASCPNTGALHLLGGHVLGPLAAAGLLGGLVAWPRRASRAG